jgi:DNA-binding NtrC family response regulator
MSALLAHPWPGNVRELEHAVERAVVLAEGAAIELRDLSLRRPSVAAPALERMTLAEVEAHLIRRAMERTGNATDAADALGLSRSALYRRLQALGIKAE